MTGLLITDDRCPKGISWFRCEIEAIHFVWSRRPRGILFVLALLCFCAPLSRVLGDPVAIPSGGLILSDVSEDAAGAFHFHDPSPQALEEARNKAKAPLPAVKDEKLCYVSLPRLFPIIKELNLREKEIPEPLKYLGGMTRLHYVFVYPDEREIILVGSAEPWDASNPAEPIGKITGRPIMELDDLICAMRTARTMRRGGENGGAFGCFIDPSKGAEGRIAKVMKEYATKPRPEKMEALVKAIGPQTVKVFNTNDDTRLAMVCVAADCKLKRYALGAEQPPVPGIGVSVENSSRIPNSRVWFESAYDPLLVSEDGNAYQLRGPRLAVKVGEEMFTEKNGTHRAMAFAKQFNLKMPQLCASVPVFADLQNMADLAMAATLIRLDKIDDKMKADFLPIHAVIGWPIQTFPVPHTVDTIVSTATSSLISGGVSLASEPLLDPEKRTVDKKRTMAPTYEIVKKFAEDASAGPVYVPR
jgi:hypothetical protein